MVRLALALLLAAIGCKDSSGAAAGDGGPARDGDGGEIRADPGLAGRAAGTDTEVRAIDLAALERPEEVPALDLSPVAATARSQARALNAAGLKLYGQRKYSAAIEKYIAALRADPGHILARYNLSCGYNLIGEPDKGLALLKEFRQKGCQACRERLVRASEDADWHSMWKHPLFADLVGVPIGDAEAEKPFWQRADPCPSPTKLIGTVGVEVHCGRRGAREGAYAKWHPRGGKALAEVGGFAAGRRDGVWQIFDDKGRLEKTGAYRLGNKHGVWSEWHPNGNQALDGRFVNGLRQGRFTWFDASGKKIKQADFENGRRGPWIVTPD